MSRGLDEKEVLRSGSARLGVRLGDADIATLLSFLERLYAWNRSAGLTAVAREDAVRLHLLDSLAAAKMLAGASEIADLGSGAGLPGIPLAVALSASHVVLVESRRRRCSFLAETVRALGLANCRVEQTDAADYCGRAAGDRPDAIVARAFLSPRDLVAVAAPMLSAGGRLVVMAGRQSVDGEELAASAAVPLGCHRQLEFTLPGGSERRQLVLLLRQGDCRGCFT